MSTDTTQPDPAAVFAMASSLWSACHERARCEELNLSEAYNGIDELMRVVMRIANQFEAWACAHVNFDETTDVWPYLLEDKFGATCIDAVGLTALASFGDRDCLRVAMRLQLPVILDDQLPVPVDVSAPNPEPNSPFRMYRIQTVRDSDDGDVVVYNFGSEPFDDEFSEPFFGLYGIYEDGIVEHIADRDTYLEALSLAKKIAPGIEFQSR